MSISHLKFVFQRYLQQFLRTALIFLQDFLHSSLQHVEGDTFKPQDTSPVLMNSESLRIQELSPLETARHSRRTCKKTQKEILANESLEREEKSREGPYRLPRPLVISDDPKMKRQSLPSLPKTKKSPKNDFTYQPLVDKDEFTSG